MPELMELGFAKNFSTENLSFRDLESRLRSHLENTRSVPEIEKTLNHVRSLLQNKDRSKEETRILKKIRQKAYDKRRNSNLKLLNSPLPFSEMKKDNEKHADISKLNETLINQKAQLNNSNSHENLNWAPPKSSFCHGFKKYMGSLDGEKFAKILFGGFIYLIVAILSSWLIWTQSAEIYLSAGFKNAHSAALGSLLLVVGSAAYFSFSRNFIAALICIYACCYEGYLMISGTVNDEISTQAAKIENNPELIFLDVAAKRDMEKYESLKQRYNDPESKVFQNEWFLKTHLNPAWEQSAKSHQEFITKQASLMPSENLNQLTLLKIFYRLGLVLLCMIFVHRLFGRWVSREAVK